MCIRDRSHPAHHASSNSLRGQTILPDSASLVSDRIFPRCHSRETCEASTLGSLLLPKPPVGPSSPLESPSRPWSQLTERAVVERPTQVGTALHQPASSGPATPRPRRLRHWPVRPGLPPPVPRRSRRLLPRIRPAALVRPPVWFAELAAPRGPPPAASAYWTDCPK